VPNVELSTDTPLPTKGNFSGSFSVLSLVEVMQTLNSARRTGVLNLDLKNGPAVLNIQNGELVSATYGELKNKDAFYALVTLEDGEFYFESNQGGFAKEMEIPTMSLLMEALRLTDEGSKQSVDDILGDSFEERPMAARVIKKTESKTSRIIKILVLVGVVVFPLVYFFIYIPSQEKEVEFTEQKTKVEISINTHQYLSAIDSWKKFLAAHKDKHPDWEESVNQEIEVIEIKQKEAMDLVKKNTEIAVKKKDFTKALENISANESVIANGGGNVQKDFMKQRDLIIKQQKEQDYIAWKSTSEINFNKAKDLVADFDHDKAIDLIKPIEENLDKVKEKELYDKVYELNKLISEREKVIKLSQFIVSDKNSTYPNKIEAYEKIILNAGIKQPRGLQANKELAIAKEKMSSFETKLKGILLSHAKDTAAVRVEVIEKLQKDVSSVEEFQFLDKEKEKILEANGESRKLLLNFQELVVKKEYKNAFLIGKKLIDQYSESEATSAVKLPFHVETNTGLILKVDGVQVELPFNGFIPFNQIVKIQADKKGCNSISLEIDKNLKNYEIELNFKKSEVWSFEYKGNLDTLPLICLNGKAVVLNNHTDLEMIYLDSGNKAWSRQINNPAVPYKKSNGTTITVGDDDFWKLDSPLCLFENYIGICSKNAETYVLSCEGGNNIVRHEMNFLSKSAPFIVRLPLLGNKAFAYTGTADGILFCVALDDQSVRFQEKLGDANNGILGVFPLNENFFVAVLEQGVQCFSLSTSKVKWSKPFVSKIKEVYSIGGKIFARQQDGLLEITDNPDTWKLIPFQLREIKEVVFNGNDFGIVGGGKTYYLDYPNGRFYQVNAPVSEKPILVSNGKYYLQTESSVQCFDAKSQKIQWETNIASMANKKIRLVGNYMFIIDGSRLHAFLIE
jgi:outer membrane protein assembly factor BamB